MMNEINDAQSFGGYYYAPYVENGKYASLLRPIGKIVGTVIGIELGSYEGKPVEGGEVGKYAGELFGQDVGSLFDNIEIIIQNINTFSQELEDYRSWVDPSGEFAD